jgi:arylsulfatase A-like enzyme
MLSRRSLLASPLAASNPRPNVLLILTDDQGYGDSSLQKNPLLSTPHLDRLARQGAVFSRFSVSPVCAPTRAALLTGRYPLRTGVHGVTKGRETLRAGEITLADCLSRAGYRTGLIGKWHLGENYPYVPHARGFDEFIGFRPGHWNWYFDSLLERNGKPYPTGGYIADALTREALRFIRQPSRDPWFLYLAYNTPHSPYQVPDSYFQRFAGRGLSPADQSIYGMVSNLDDNLGRLLSSVNDNTIVLFLCDNGPQTDRFNAGLRGRKGSVYEGGTRSPLLIRYPARVRAGQTIDRIAAHIDILPTILELTGVQRLGGPPLDGLSLVPLLNGDTKSFPDRPIFTHADHQPDPTRPYPGALRRQRFKMVNGNELYDLIADPAEQHNLASTYPAELRSLVREYETWFASTLERFHPGAPPIPVGHAEENPAFLSAPQAQLSQGLRFFSGQGFAHDFVTGFSSPNDSLSWTIHPHATARYEATVLYRGPRGSRIFLGPLSALTRHATNPAAIPLPHRVPPANEAPVVHWSRLSLGSLALPASPTTLALHIVGPSCDIKGLELRRL